MRRARRILLSIYRDHKFLLQIAVIWAILWWLNQPVKTQVTTITVCTTGCDYPNSNLQGALNAATSSTSGGFVILLESQHTYTAPSTGFVLGDKCSNATTWDCVTVRTGVTATGTVMSTSLFPAATEMVTEQNAALFAKIVPSVNNEAAMRTVYPSETGSACAAVTCMADGWTVKWLEFGPKADWPGRALLRFGSEKAAVDLPSGNAQDELSEIPSHLTAFQNYIHGDKFAGQHQGLYLASADTRVYYNRIDYIMSMTETQAITCLHGTGPFDIQHNMINATGENFMCGGGDTFLRATATVTGTPTATSFQLANGIWEHTNGTTGTAGLTACTTWPCDSAHAIYSGIYVSLLHAGVEYGMIKCTYSGTTCTVPTLPFTPSVGDTVRWSWVQGGMTFKYNWLIKRPEWFTKILATPTGVGVAAGTGGSLPAGSVCYRVAARAFVSTQTIKSDAAAEQCQTVSASGKATITWTAVTNATTYRIYGRTSGAQSMYWDVSAAAGTTFTDDGTAGTAGTVTAGDTWPMKNNFELKQGDGASPMGTILIEGNIFDYSVCCDQSNGISIKTNNQNGKDVSSIIRNLTFQNNWARHMNRALALTCTSTGNTAPVQASGVMENVAILNNLFTDLSTAWVKAGGSGVANSAFSITSGNYANTVRSRGCINIQIKHNTVLADTDGLNGPFDVLINTTTDKHEIFMENNIMARDCLTAGCTSAARNSLKGFNPNNAGEGAPGWTATTTSGSTAHHNVWPDGTITDYTALVFPNSFFGTDATIKGYLNSYNNCKDGSDINGCALSGSTPLDNAASDSTDVGANVANIKAFTDVITGATGGGSPPTFLSKMDSNVDNSSGTVTTNAGTISGSNKWIGCMYSINTLSVSGTSITINDTGETLTKRLTVDHDNGGGSIIRDEFWDLVNPTDSTGTTTITGANTASAAGKSLSCVVYNNVNQSTPTGTLESSHGNAVSSTVTFNTNTSGGLLLDFAAVRTNTQITEGGNQTARVERIGTNAGNATSAISEKIGGTVGQTMSYSSDDAAAKTWASIGVPLRSAGVANTAPSVNAGTDLSVPYLGLASLNGTVTDDGLPNGTLTYSWTKFSGPGTVTFDNSTAVDTTALFSASGTYVLRLTASDSALSASDDVQVIVGTPTTDFTIQAEDFDTGGEGVGYHDLDAANQGGAYRPSDGVDIEATTDTGGGYDVGWTSAGEWLQYTATVTTTGTYSLSFRVASSGAGGTFHMEVDAVNVTGTMTIPTTGGWQTYTTLTKTGVSISSGSRVFKLVMDTNGPTTGAVGNFNWASVALSSTNNPPAVDVGGDLSTTLPGGVDLTATTTDDGPPSALTFVWTQISGPGTVIFGNPNLEDTTAAFSIAGTYVLRLTASDGQLSGFDELTVTVNPAPAVTTTLRADRFMLTQGSCAIRSGSGPPGNLSGCDVYIDQTDGRVFGQSARLSKLTAADDLTLNAAGKDIVPEQNFDQNLGSSTKKFASLWASELRIDTLVARDVISTIGGRVMVAQTTRLTQDVDPAATTITVRHNSMVAGDRIYMEARGSVEYMAVLSGASGTGPYTYTVTRNLDGTGANSWIAGDAVVNTGQIGNGMIDLYADHGLKSLGEQGPTIVGNVRNSLTYNDWSPRWAIGNLNGLYGYTTNTYGAAFGVPTAAWVKIDATNGVRLGYNTATNVSIDTAGNATFAGKVTASEGSFLPSYSDNVIANGTFEGSTTTSRLAGWVEDTHTGPGGGVIAACCGVTGPGTMQLVPGAGFWTQATYMAVPVLAGQTYRVNMSTYAGVATSAGVYIRVYQSTSSAVNVRRVTQATATSPDVTAVSFVDLCASCSASTGWTKREFVYTVPAGVTWVSLNVINFTDNALSGGTYVSEFHVDDVEMQKQIGSGHIQARSISADRIIAGAITSNEIAANTITAGNIAASTITGAKIAGTTITASNIVSGTITGTQIAGSTITADKLNVGSLSAISADLGTVTAGSITGVTISGGTVTGGSGSITLNSTGLHFSGDGGNSIIDMNGVTLQHRSSDSSLYIPAHVVIDAASGLGTSGDVTASGFFSSTSTTPFVGSNMGSATGTTVVYDGACSCLKKQSSAEKYKENIVSWTPTVPSVLAFLNANLIKFDYINGTKGVIGMSADSMLKVAPDMVNVDDQGNAESIRQDVFNAYVIAVLRELLNRVPVK